jgi:hypothetical protein
MEKEIEEIIKKNLPEHVGEVLKKRLTEADNDAFDLVKYKQFYEDTKDSLAKANLKIEEYKKLDERNFKLEDRERTVAEKERMLDVTTLKIQLEEANKRADTVINFTSGLVRNVEFRKQVYDSQYQAGYSDGRGNYIQPSPIDTHHNEVKTTERQFKFI